MPVTVDGNTVMEEIALAGFSGNAQAIIIGASSET
jgi:hypothetical protein